MIPCFQGGERACRPVDPCAQRSRALGQRRIDPIPQQYVATPRQIPLLWGKRVDYWLSSVHVLYPSYACDFILPQTFLVLRQAEETVRLQLGLPHLVTSLTDLLEEADVQLYLAGLVILGKVEITLR